MSHSDSMISLKTTSAWTNPFTWIVIAIIGSFFFYLLQPAFQQAGSRPMPPGYRNMRSIGIALHNYQHQYNAWPHHPNGPDHALYQLRALIEPEAFDLIPMSSPRREARWDDVHQTVVNNDFWYWNPPAAMPFRFCQIIGIVNPIAEFPREMHVLLMDASVRWIRVPDHVPDRRAYFGALMLDSELATNDDIIVDAWNELDVAPKNALTRGVHHSDTPNYRWEHGQISYDAKFRDGLLAVRVWSSPQGTITETIIRDANGLVTELQREPADWRSFWPKRAESQTPDD